MANVNTGKKRIGILTGGGDVPGLNPAIRAVTVRALREGWEVIGLRRGWAGIIDVVRDKDYDNSNNYQVLTEEIVNRAGRTGGTFLLRIEDTDKARSTDDSTDAILDGMRWLGLDWDEEPIFQSRRFDEIPLDYTEVAITRRAYRDGDGQQRQRMHVRLPPAAARRPRARRCGRA